jgi:uncharacterized protein (TIRG00374 family)
MKKRLFFYVQILLTILLPLYLLRDFNWAEWQALLAGLSPRFFIYSLGLFLLAQVLFASKWYLILQTMGVKVPWRAVIQQHFIGLYFSNFVPTTFGGDAAKIYYLGKQEGYTNVTASVFLDRFLGFFFITTMGMVLSWRMEFDTQAIHTVRSLLSLLFVVFVVLILGMIFLPLERWWAWFFQRVPRLAFLESRLNRLMTYIRLIAQKPQALVPVFVLSSLYYWLLSLIYLAFFELTSDVQAHLWPVMTILLSIAILSNLPLTINGIGLREQLHFLLLAPMGFSKEIAVSISLLIFIYMLLCSLGGYVLWVRWGLKHHTLLESTSIQATQAQT